MPNPTRQFSLRGLFWLTCGAAAYISLFVPHVPLTPYSSWLVLLALYLIGRTHDGLFIHLAIPGMIGGCLVLVVGGARLLQLLLPNLVSDGGAAVGPELEQASRSILLLASLVSFPWAIIAARRQAA